MIKIKNKKVLVDDVLQSDDYTIEVFDEKRPKSALPMQAMTLSRHYLEELKRQLNLIK